MYAGWVGVREEGPSGVEVFLGLVLGVQGAESQMKVQSPMSQ